MFSPFASGLLSGILAGVLVAVFSQLLLQGIVEPVQRLKGKIAEIGMQLGLLNNRYSSIDNDYTIMKYDIDLMNRLSIDIHSLPYQILMYSKIRYLFGLPSRKAMKRVYCKLNALSYMLISIESVTKKMQDKFFSRSFQGEDFQKDNVQQSQIEQRDRSINYVKTLTQEIKKLLNIRQPNHPLPLKKPPSRPVILHSITAIRGRLTDDGPLRWPNGKRVVDDDAFEKVSCGGHGPAGFFRQGTRQSSQVLLQKGQCSR